MKQKVSGPIRWSDAKMCGVRRSFCQCLDDVFHDLSTIAWSLIFPNLVTKISSHRILSLS